MLLAASTSSSPLAALTSWRPRQSSDGTPTCGWAWLTPRLPFWPSVMRARTSSPSTNGTFGRSVAQVARPSACCPWIAPERQQFAGAFVRHVSAVELEHLLAELELLIRARTPLDEVLDAVALDRLDHRDPGQIVQENRMHLVVVIGSQLRVHAEARLVAQAVELRVAPVVPDAARTEQAPHHAVGVLKSRG